MLLTRPIAGMFSLVVLVLIAGVVYGQAYPTKPIRFITTGIGGTSDFTARLISDGISGALGQPVLVDNRGSGITPGVLASRGQPDGYTLVLAGGSFFLSPLLQPAPYDPVRDFSPITLVSIEPQVLIVSTSVTANSVKELIALAKASPGKLNYASRGAGTTSHLTMELFKSMAGVDIVNIPYTNPAQAMTDMFGGRVQASFGSAASVTPHVKAGRLRALAVTSAKSSVLMPGVPPVAVSVPGYEAIAITGIWTVAKTPAAIINRLNKEIVGVLNQPDVKRKLLDAGQDVIGSSPKQLDEDVKADIARFGKVIKDLGIRAD